MDKQHLNRPWNVFIPHELLYEPSGYLWGSVNIKMLLVCVHGISRKEPGSGSPNLVGHWQRSEREEPRDSDLRAQCQCWVVLEPDRYNNISICNLFIAGSMASSSVVCVLYNPQELESSYVLMQCDDTRHGMGNKNTTFTLGTGTRKKKEKCPRDSEDGCLDTARVFEKQEVENQGSGSCVSPKLQSQESGDILSALVRAVVQKQQNGLVNPEKGLKIFHQPSSSVQPNLFFWLGGLVFLELILLPMRIWSYIGYFFMLGTTSMRAYSFYLPKLLQTPSIVDHLMDRSSQCRSALRLEKGDKWNKFLLYNSCWLQLLDSFIGIGIIFLTMHFGLADGIASYIMDWADNVAAELTALVQWLMGAPAGLKLNAQLTKFLGHFFIYHIYLWTGYLVLLRSVMSSVIWYCSCIGVLGITAQLCLIKDVLSMLTLHIYCFYVYAARIFHLQIYAVSSLWRLFRGKKWNVLRSRVDSASYNTDQLFVGTLLFTVLLFLLPTTVLYYAVFTVLRLLVLTAQGVLTRAVAIVSSMPVFTIFLRLFAPEFVAGSAVFRVSHLPEDQSCLVLSMQTCQIPLGNLLKLTSPLLSLSSDLTHTWQEFLSHLLTGSLIYPWVERKSEVKNAKAD